MLRRSRSVNSKQGTMPESPSLPSPLSSLFASPRLFVGCSSKALPDLDSAAMSPTSILETKPFGNPFLADKTPRKPHPWDSGESKAIGLGLVDALHNDTKTDKKPFRPDSRMVLFGSQLKIQIPPIRSSSISPTGSVESPHSPIEFGIKTKSSQLSLHSPLGFEPMSCSSPRITTGSLSPEEMELSEDYTRVISHGPNPRTTHIFDNCIVESCGGRLVSSSRKESGSSGDRSGYHSDDFLSFCHGCKRSLSQGKDIFIYRGERAFCSRECREEDMMFDEGVDDFSPDLSDFL